MARREPAQAMATAALLGAAGAWRLRARMKEEQRKCEMRARTGAGGCWRDNAALRRVVAGAVRATATRGHRDLHAARGSYRCRPLKISIQFIQS